HFNFTPVLNKIVSRLLITNKLIEEKSNLYNVDASPILNNWLLHSTQCSPISIHNRVEIIIEENTNDVEILISQSADRIKLFNELINFLLKELNNKTTSIAEEG